MNMGLIWLLLDWWTYLVSCSCSCDILNFFENGILCVVVYKYLEIHGNVYIFLKSWDCKNSWDDWHSNYFSTVNPSKNSKFILDSIYFTLSKNQSKGGFVLDKERNCIEYCLFHSSSRAEQKSPLKLSSSLIMNLMAYGFGLNFFYIKIHFIQNLLMQ